MARDDEAPQHSLGAVGGAATAAETDSCMEALSEYGFQELSSSYEINVSCTGYIHGLKIEKGYHFLPENPLSSPSFNADDSAACSDIAT